MDLYPASTTALPAFWHALAAIVSTTVIAIAGIVGIIIHHKLNTKDRHIHYPPIHARPQGYATATPPRQPGPVRQYPNHNQPGAGANGPSPNAAPRPINYNNNTPMPFESPEQYLRRLQKNKDNGEDS